MGAFVSPTCRRLSDDRRNIAQRARSRLRYLFGFQLIIALEPCECFPQVRVEARGISKRRIENRFHITSHRHRVSSKRRHQVVISQRPVDTRILMLVACFAAVRALAYSVVWLGELRGAVARRGKCCPHGLGPPRVCPRGLSSTTATERTTIRGQTGLLCATVWTVPYRNVLRCENITGSFWINRQQAPRNAIGVNNLGQVACAIDYVAAIVRSGLQNCPICRT